MTQNFAIVLHLWSRTEEFQVIREGWIKMIKKQGDTLTFQQDRMLQQFQQEAIPVTIFLKNGIKLQGIIAQFDAHVIILLGQGTQLIYKHAVLSIIPQVLV